MSGKLAEFDRSYATSYQSAIVSIALSYTISESSNDEECRDLEGSVTQGH